MDTRNATGDRAGQPPQQPPLEDLYDACVQRLLEGEEVDLDQLCREHPAHAEELRAHLKILMPKSASKGRSGAPLRPLLAEQGLPFERLGEFRLLRQLGAGGMGVVYLAEQASLKRLVALKVIRPEYARTAAAKGRFEREVTAVAKLNHPHIVKVYSAGEEHGVRYLAMELVHGQGLDQLLAKLKDRKERAAIPLVLRVAADVARALACAHEAGILHRDVKPSNIRVTPDGRGLLLDFGLAREVDSAGLTRSGEFQGTPYYVAPEQVKGRFQDLDGRADVFSLGATLYESLTGSVPFPGDTVEAVLHALLHEPPAPPRRTHQALSRDIETVVLKSLEKDRGRRYASAAEFADDLESLLELRPIRARPPGRLRRAEAAVRRNRRLAVPVALATALALASGGSYALDAWRDARAFSADLAAAGEQLAQGAIEPARAAAERALLRRPADPRAVARRAEVAAAEQRATASAARARAAELLASFRAAQDGELRRRAVVQPLLDAREVRFVEPEEQNAAEAGVAELAARARDVEVASAAFLEAVQTARALEGDSPILDGLLADYHMERFRAALARADRPAEQRAAAEVERFDRAGRYREELLGMGRVAFQIEPDGAEVHLFRYVDQSELAKEGERRLVPVSVRPMEPPRPWGSWVLRAAESAEGIAAGDVLFKVAGRPVRNTVLVERGAGAVQRLDKVASVDGRTVRDPFDAWVHDRAAGGSAAEHRFVFERLVEGGAAQKFELTAPSLAAAGIRVAAPADIVRAGGVKVDVWHDGAVRTVALESGLDARATGTPLFLGPGSLYATAPRPAAEIAPGSYVAVLRAPGCEDQRYPFVVPRGGDAVVEARLLPEGSSVAGFVYVPGGRFTSGGVGGVAAEARELPGFWMMEREVTLGDYLLFLNDPATQALLATEEGRALLPQSTLDLGDGLFERGTDGAFALARDEADLPAYGVTFAAASAYAEWRTAAERARGRRVRFLLPAALEWEKAARGADARQLVCGNHFVAQWLKSRFARPVLDLEPVLSFPVDESPFGVFDMGGSVSEWCRDQGPSAPVERAVRGGAWNHPLPQAFRAAYQQFVRAPTAAASIGFRLMMVEDSG